MFILHVLILVETPNNEEVKPISTNHKGERLIINPKHNTIEENSVCVCEKY